MTIDPVQSTTPTRASRLGMSPGHFFDAPAIAQKIPSYGPLILFFDKDGTLDETITPPDRCFVPEKVILNLAALSELPDVFVGILSGRSYTQLKDLLYPSGRVLGHLALLNSKEINWAGLTKES